MCLFAYVHYAHCQPLATLALAVYADSVVGFDVVFAAVAFIPALAVVATVAVVAVLSAVATASVTITAAAISHQPSAISNSNSNRTCRM